LSCPSSASRPSTRSRSKRLPHGRFPASWYRIAPAA
jgi:hypothetical protein